MSWTPSAPARANVRIQKTKRLQAVNRYRRTVLQALREVDAIVAYRNVQSRGRALSKTITADQHALKLAR